MTVLWKSELCKNQIEIPGSRYTKSNTKCISLLPGETSGEIEGDP